MKWVVVGAGSAGCVVARRLVDAGHDTVLVEAGPSLRPDAVPPAIDGDDSFAALTVPGRTHNGLSARRTRTGVATPYLRGRGEGGSSAVNSMVGLRGDRRLYESWGWTDTDTWFERVLVPTEVAHLADVGRVGRVVLDAEPRAVRAPLTRRNRRRVTAAEAYLWPVLDTLTTVTDASVDVVEFDGSGAATGVRLTDGRSIEADAVAVCAGAIHTPAILLRSGASSPGIGTGLADHPAAAFTLRLADSGGARGLTTSVLADLDPLQILPVDHLGPHAPPDLAVLLVALMRPESASGTVRLGSDEPTADPHVDLDLLSDPSDVDRLCDGVEIAMDLLATPQLSDIVSEAFIDDVGTPASSLEGRSDVVTWLRSRGADYVHASSSMAAALGDHGRVTGHERLVVADASAFPSIPDVNTHLPTMMLAERFVQQWIDTDASLRS